MVLVEDDPVTVTAVVITLASTLSKFETVTVSPVVWSVLIDRLMAVMPPAAASTSLSVPLLPSIETSVPR